MDKIDHTPKTTPPDRLTARTLQVLSNVKQMVKCTGHIHPLIHYWKCGRAHRFPLCHRMLLAIGQRCTKEFFGFTHAIQSVGPEFTTLCMNLAERYENPISRLEDEAHYQCEISHLLAHIDPDAYVVIVEDRKRDCLMAIGRNKVKKYEVTQPFHIQGNDIVFGTSTSKTKYDGGISAGLFGDVYTPSLT